MMVGHNEVESKPTRSVGSSKGANACIDAYHELDACSSSVLKHVVAHAITFADAMRHVKLSNTAQQLDASLQNNDCCGSIHIVIAIDKQRLFRGDSALQAFNGNLHAKHRVRSMQMRKLWMQKA